MKMKSFSKCNIACLGIGSAMIAIGLALGIYSQFFFSGMINNELELSNSSYAFKLWLHTPVPLFLEVYLFNWTNSEEFMKDKSVIPHFEEVGPFVFKEVHDRVNITWNDNNTVSYNQTRSWTFVPEESLELSTKITNLNVIVATISQLIKNRQTDEMVLNLLFSLYEKFFVTQPAKNWLFEGIDDKILDIINRLMNLLHISIPIDKFGWFYGRNMSSSYDGIFTVRTGVDDIYNVGVMDKWNHMNVTNYFKDECAMVNGTSGEMFPPLKPMQDNSTIFISDICSSITLNKTGSEFVEGIKSFRFVGEKTAFDNGQIHPENKCFCKEECAPYGSRDTSGCRMGAPIFFSFPHFYNGDESYRKSVAGMNPNKSEHEFLLQLDPATGIPVNIRAQLQINVLLKPNPYLRMFKDVPKIYIPMMWFRQKARITPELASKVKMLRFLPSLGSGLLYAIAGIGLMIVGICLIVMYRRRSDSDSELLIPSNIDTEEDEQKTES